MENMGWGEGAYEIGNGKVKFFYLSRWELTVAWAKVVAVEVVRNCWILNVFWSNWQDLLTRLNVEKERKREVREHTQVSAPDRSRVLLPLHSEKSSSTPVLISHGFSGGFDFVSRCLLHWFFHLCSLDPLSVSVLCSFSPYFMSVVPFLYFAVIHLFPPSMFFSLSMFWFWLFQVGD